ncbi:hypothetical protein [Selenomonas sp.]|uniref:hypothetical protein n=1 Tax=Selenomonas sp. TaxID=2053611 RepID=UPI0025D21281|nr:hypothetical protein [Selenomonas sp.]MBQ1868764.1 hypothetical protein [Selenomonas sp.]
MMRTKNFFFTQTIKRYTYGTFLLLGFVIGMSGGAANSPKGAHDAAPAFELAHSFKAFEGISCGYRLNISSRQGQCHKRSV